MSVVSFITCVRAGRVPTRSELLDAADELAAGPRGPSAMGVADAQAPVLTELAIAHQRIRKLEEQARIYEQMITSAARVLTQQGDRLPEPTGYVHRSGHSEHLRGAAVCDVMGGGQWSRG